MQGLTHLHVLPCPPLPSSLPPPLLVSFTQLWLYHHEIWKYMCRQVYAIFSFHGWIKGNKKRSHRPTVRQAMLASIIYTIFNLIWLTILDTKEVQNTYMHTHMHTHILMCTHFKFNEEVAFLGRIYFRVYMLVFNNVTKVEKRQLKRKLFIWLVFQKSICGC